MADGALLAGATVNGVPMAVAVLTSEDDTEGSSTLQAWNLAAGEPVGEPVSAHEGGVLGLRLAEWEGRQFAVTVGEHDGTVRVWAFDG